MPKRRGRRSRKPFKLKLKKKTIYTIFGIGFFLTGIFLLISFFSPSESTDLLSTQLNNSFGSGAILAPVVLLFLGFLFLQLKFYLSRINVTIGAVLLFVSYISLTKSGAVGSGIFGILSEILGNAGSYMVFIAGLLVGVIVFLDTSIDEMIQLVGAIFATLNKLIPQKTFRFFKRWEKASF